MKNRRFAICGVILAISTLLPISILSPSVAADTPWDQGELRTPM